MPGITAPQRARRSRKPTGLPNPPMILLAGPEKSGKSRAAAEGTRSELIGMTYWIEIGGSEGTADYYGRLPGTNYEIVEHEGTYQDILDAVRWAVAQPPAVEGKRNMIVVDNVSVLWDMLSDEQALYARWRAERKAQENRRRGPNPDLPVTVDPDLWNRAKDRWGAILWHLRRHSGPTLLLARQEVVTAFENDKPTRDKTRKIKAEKNLAASVDAIVELHALGEAYLTGVRTLHWDITPGQSERFEEFNIDTLLRRLGFQEAAVARQVVETRPEAYLDEQQQAQERQQQPQQHRPPQQRQQRPPQQGEQGQAQQGEQGQAPALQQGDERWQLTGDQAVELIRVALSDETDPETCLKDIREKWGIQFLQQLPTHTRRGQMSADELITRSLEYAKGRAEWKRQNGGAGQPDGTGQQGEGAPSAPSTPPPSQAEPASVGEHQEHREPDGDEGPPPPPDPQAEEPPFDESPEETSAAEEPQDVPAPQTVAAPRTTRQSKNEAIAMKALTAEADVQARIRMMTKGEHLGPISQEGDPQMTVLRDFLLAHRPALIAQLEQEGHAELATIYRTAPKLDPQIAQKLAPYFAGAPAGPK